MIAFACASRPHAVVVMLGIAACATLPVWRSSSPAAEVAAQEPNTWVKCSPAAGGPPSPGMGYEASLAYDPIARRVIRWAGHNQGGGGEQNGETWVFDPATTRWELREPNTSPPGACCNQQNVFDTSSGRFLRFPAFSGNHGWQWFREIDLNDSSVWSYDLSRNTWRDLRPLPARRAGPLRCASWDEERQVAVVFGGEGSRERTLVFDPYTNTWTRMNSALQPEPRSGGNMAYDAARKVHVLFGSQFMDDPQTWVYDLRKNEWRGLKPSVQPPTDRNDPVLAYDAASRVVVAVVRAVDRSKGTEPSQGHLETWAYDAGRNTWEKRNPPREPDGWKNRRRIMVAAPDLNLILMENFADASDRIPGVRNEQQIWAYRGSASADRTPSLPRAEIGVTTTRDGARVDWQPISSPDVTGTIIERSEGDRPWQVELQEVARVGRGQTAYEDRGLTPGRIYHYAVRAIDKAGRTGPRSSRARTQPRIVADAVVSVISRREVKVAWAALPARDIAGYHIERAAVDVASDDQVLRQKKQVAALPEPSVAAIRAIGPFNRLTREPIAGTTFIDTTVDLARPQPIEGASEVVRGFRDDQLDPGGKPYRFAVYAYRVRAVNALGVEGGDSPFVPTIPSAPQWVFSREDGRSCNLKWAPGPEAGLQGYRIYRMEGPRTNGPGQTVTRVNKAPVSEARFVDNNAGGQTRRYWIVAVDALGQEGFPSAPTWYDRQYRRYYVPFVGEWHQ